VFGKKLVAKNIAYLYVIQLLRLSLPLALLSVLTKVLSGTQYSVYIYTLASAVWLSTFVEYGFNVSGTRRVAAAAEPDALRAIIIETQAAKWLLVGLSVIFLFWALTFSAVFQPYPEWAACAWLLGVMMGMTPGHYYQGTSNLRLVAMLEIIGSILIFAFILLLVRSTHDFWRLGVALVSIRLMIWQTLEQQMLSKIGLRYVETLAIRRGVLALKDGWRIFLVNVSASLYTSFNIVLLGGVSNAYAVAVYGSCERLIRAGLAFIAQATSAIFPKLASMKSGDSVQLSKTRRLSLLAFAMGSIVCLPLVWFSAPLLSKYLFNETLPDLAHVLRIMALVIPAIAISNVLAFHFLVVDHQEHILNWVVAAAVPVSLAMGYLLSSTYGAAGMASTWVVIEWLVTLTLAAIIYRRYRRTQ
jgi:PST family polysaccharide transporter